MALRHWLLALVILKVSCTTTSEISTEFPKEPWQDSTYHEIFQKNTREYEVIHNFETRFIVHVTRLGPDFRAAMASRYQRIFNEPQPLLAEVSNQTGFFVSIYVAKEEARDLSNDVIWNLQLKRDNSLNRPIMISQLTPKQQWQPFFPYITAWSQEYLVLFDAAAPASEGQRELLEGGTLELILSSSKGRVTLKW